MLANICVTVRKKHQLSICMPPEAEGVQVSVLQLLAMPLLISACMIFYSYFLQAVSHIVFASKFMKFVLLSRFVDL